jgi:cyclophilin family peptidyl-prolyl cis-trans isomerase/HEAT repeat protein
MTPTQRTTVLALALLLAAGRAAPAADPAAPSAADARLNKLARILRAADRRTIDDGLRELLADPDADVRSRAVAGFGQVGDRASAAEIAPLTKDPDPRVRAATAFALGLIGETSPRDPIHLLVADPSPIVRGAAADALGRIHDEQSRSRVAALLADADMTVRVQANLAAWKFADPSPLLPAVVTNLGATDARVRASAAYALARLASAAVAAPSSGAPVGRLSESSLATARGALASHVADPDSEVRMQIARGLAHPATPHEITVVGTLTGDRDPRVRVNAVRSFAYPGMPLRPYLERAAADKDPHVGRAAIEALGKMCGGDVTITLKTLLPKFDDAWRREAALVSMTQCDISLIPDIVAGLLDNPNPVMRLSAVQIIAPRTEAGARKAAKTLLSDSAPMIQAAVIPVAIDEDAPLGTLLGGTPESADPVVRAAVAEAYGKRIAAPRPGTESKDTLVASLDRLWEKSGTDSIPDAKLAVLDAAAAAGKEDRIRAILERGLGDKDVIVRRRAAAKLQEVFGEDRSASIGPSADRPLEDYEAIVRWSQVPHAALLTIYRPGMLPGRITIALDADAAPMAAWNFAQLAGREFYDSRVVHRMVPNFVVQDGDPRGDGFGGPGYSIRDEFNPMRFTAGAVGMASDGKDTAGSQWFVTLSAQPHLDGRYTAFGHVVQGLRDVLPQILPGDMVASIRIYEGNGSEPLPGVPHSPAAQQPASKTGVTPGTKPKVGPRKPR